MVTEEGSGNNLTEMICELFLLHFVEEKLKETFKYVSRV